MDPFHANKWIGRPAEQKSGAPKTHVINFFFSIALIAPSAPAHKDERSGSKSCPNPVRPLRQVGCSWNFQGSSRGSPIACANRDGLDQRDLRYGTLKDLLYVVRMCGWDTEIYRVGHRDLKVGHRDCGTPRLVIKNRASPKFLHMLWGTPINFFESLSAIRGV